jgi:hypothetical protein
MRFHREVASLSRQEGVDEGRRHELDEIRSDSQRHIERCRQQIRAIDEVGIIDTQIGSVISMACRVPEGTEPNITYVPGPSSPSKFPVEYPMWAAGDGLTREAYLIGRQLPHGDLLDIGEMEETAIARYVVNAAYRILENELAQAERNTQSASMPSGPIPAVRKPEEIRKRLGEIILSPERRDELVRGIHLP